MDGGHRERSRGRGPETQRPPEVATPPPTAVLKIMSPEEMEKKTKAILDEYFQIHDAQVGIGGPKLGFLERSLICLHTQYSQLAVCKLHVQCVSFIGAGNRNRYRRPGEKSTHCHFVTIASHMSTPRVETRTQRWRTSTVPSELTRQLNTYSLGSSGKSECQKHSCGSLVIQFSFIMDQQLVKYQLPSVWSTPLGAVAEIEISFPVDMDRE